MLYKYMLIYVDKTGSIIESTSNQILNARCQNNDAVFFFMKLTYLNKVST